MIFVNGLKLEDPTWSWPRRTEGRRRRDRRRSATEVLPEDDYIYDFSFPKEDGKPNPHLWTDPTYAKKYAEVVTDTLVDADPANAADYEANYDAFAAQVDEFDAAMRTRFATDPARRSASC